MKKKQSDNSMLQFNDFSDLKFYSSQYKQHKKGLTIRKDNSLESIQNLHKTSKMSENSRRLMSAITNKRMKTDETKQLSIQNIKKKILQFSSLKEEVNSQIFVDFQKSSLLVTKHDQLVQKTKLLSQDMMNTINTNYYFTQNNEDNQNFFGNNKKLEFILFKGLKDLDQNILKELLTQKRIHDDIGKPILTSEEPCQQIRIEHLMRSYEITFPLMQILIRQASQHDKQLGIFIESIWKYYVLIIDLLCQSFQNKFKEWLNQEVLVQLLLNFKVSQIKQQYEAATKQNEYLQNQLVQNIKQFNDFKDQQMRLNNDLNEKNHALQQDFYEYRRECEKMGDLEMADEKMNSLGLRALELDKMIKIFDRQLVDNRISFERSYKGLAQIMIQRKQDNQPLHSYITDILETRTGVWDQAIIMHISCHPFVKSYFTQGMKKKETEDSIYDQNSNYLTILGEFFDYLQMNYNPNYSISQQFVLWLGREENIPGLCIWLKQQSENKQNLKHPNFIVAQLYNILFGLNGQIPLCQDQVNELLFINRGVNLIQRDKNRSVKVIQIFILSFSSLPTRIPQKFTAQINLEPEQLCSFLLQYAQFLQTAHSEQWENECLTLKQQILENGLGTEVPYYKIGNLDTRLVQNYMILKYQLQYRRNFSYENGRIVFKEQENQYELRLFIDDCLNQVRNISLNTPFIFQLIENKQIRREEIPSSPDVSGLKKSSIATRRKQTHLNSLFIQKVSEIVEQPRKATAQLRKFDEKLRKQ